MPDQRNMLDQTKMTAPIPAVGAAGEQSQNLKTNDIIPKDRKNNNSLHTLSMTELYDTTYPPKAAIIDGLLYAGTYLIIVGVIVFVASDFPNLLQGVHDHQSGFGMMGKKRFKLIEQPAAKRHGLRRKMQV